MLPLPLRLLQSRIPILLPPQHPALLAHTIHQTLLFDESIRDAGFALEKTWAGRNEKLEKQGESRGEWQGLAGEVLGREEWFQGWVQGEISCELIPPFFSLSLSLSLLFQLLPSDDSLIACLCYEH